MLDSRDFPVLRNAPFVWLGHSELRPPYRMVRLDSVHSHVVACVHGEGRVLINGAVQSWHPGQVLLAPVGRHHAFEIEGPGPWVLAWIFWDDHKSAPLLSGEAARLIREDTEAFVSLIRLLTREALGPAEPSAMSALVDLLALETRRLSGESSPGTRLYPLWAEVEVNPSRDWKLATLAKLAHVSAEHLRRLCLRDCGRSPMEQVTHLRMRRAGILLRSSSATLESIAEQVGYGSLYAFSVAFKRWSGVSPGRYRRAGGT